MPDDAPVAKRRLSPKQKKLLAICLAVFTVLVLTTLIVLGYFSGWFSGIFGLHKYDKKLYNVKRIANEDLSVHFLQCGEYNGDCIYVKAGENDILIDAGPRDKSANAIDEYIRRFCKDGILEYVVVTHADGDHISGFYGTKASPGIFERYECKTIIEFAKTNKTTDKYYSYCDARDKEIAEGAKCYSALECVREQRGAKRIYDLGNGVTMEILYQEYYETYTSTENDYSVCLTLNAGSIHCLLTGDLQKDGEASLVKYNPDLPQMTLYKGAHHGSRTSSNEVLLSKIRPEYVCVCCVAGSVEYTQDNKKTFPTQDFVDRISSYTDNVFVTNLAKVKRSKTGLLKIVGCKAFNGDIVFGCTDGRVSMYFSESNVKLKDSVWMSENRTMPANWGEK